VKFVRKDGIVAHWDIDGLASAVLVAKHYGVPLDSIRLSATGRAQKFVKELLSAGANHVFVLDISFGEGSLKDLAKNLKKHKAGMTVVDHHVWEASALELADSLHNIRLVLNSSAPCTAQIVYDELLSRPPLRSELRTLLEMAVDDDTYSNKMQLTSKWRVLLRWGDWDFRYKVLEALMEGVLWPEWAERMFQEVWSEYSKLLGEAAKTAELAEVGDVRVLFAYPDQRVHPGDLHYYLENVAEKKADLYVLVYGKSVSLRSAKINVAEVAKALGGGGHEKAAGASLREHDEKSVKSVLLSLLKKIALRK